MSELADNSVAKLSEFRTQYRENRISAHYRGWLHFAFTSLVSLGVVAYELLTGGLPYGEAIESIRTRRDLERLEYLPSYHSDPMIPVWLDGALRKAVAPEPGRRYAEVSEFVYDLRHPNPKFLGQGHRPLIERDPLRFWKATAAALLAAQLLTLWYFLS